MEALIFVVLSHICSFTPKHHTSGCAFGYPIHTLSPYSYERDHGCVYFFKCNIMLNMFFQNRLTQLLQAIVSPMIFDQGCKFSDYNLISDFFTSTPSKIVFEMSSLERMSQGFVIEPDFQKKSL